MEEEKKSGDVKMLNVFSNTSIAHNVIEREKYSEKKKKIVSHLFEIFYDKHFDAITFFPTLYSQFFLREKKKHSETYRLTRHFAIIEQIFLKKRFFSLSISLALC